MPPAQNMGTGSSPSSATSCTSSTGARSSLAHANSSALVGHGELADVAEDRTQVADGLDDVAGAGLALGADHARALGDAPQRLAQVGGAAHERHGERPLVDVVRLVGRGEHLALVDVVDAERLEHLGLGEVADPALGHHRDGDRGLDALDHRRVAHAGDAAVAPDVGGHPLERHHRDRAGVFGDLRLLGVTTSMMTPPRSISASPRLTRAVPVVRPVVRSVMVVRLPAAPRRRYFFFLAVVGGAVVTGGTVVSGDRRRGHVDREPDREQLDPRAARAQQDRVARRRRRTWRAGPCRGAPTARCAARRR